MRRNECENRAFFGQMWGILAFAMAPQTQGMLAVGIGHFVGHWRTATSQKGAISFPKHLDFNFF